MPFFLQYFWRQVLGCAAERVSLLVLLQYFRESEICQAHVAVLIEQNILGLEVTVDNFLAVQVAESIGDDGRVELRPVFLEVASFSKVHEQLTSSDELHYEENLLVSLKHVLHAHKERVIGLHQDFLL